MWRLQCNNLKCQGHLFGFYWDETAVTNYGWELKNPGEIISPDDEFQIAVPCPYCDQNGLLIFKKAKPNATMPGKSKVITFKGRMTKKD